MCMSCCMSICACSGAAPAKTQASAAAVWPRKFVRISIPPQAKADDRRRARDAAHGHGEVGSRGDGGTDRRADAGARAAEAVRIGMARLGAVGSNELQRERRDRVAVV